MSVRPFFVIFVSFVTFVVTTCEGCAPKLLSYCSSVMIAFEALMSVVPVVGLILPSPNSLGRTPRL